MDQISETLFLVSFHSKDRPGNAQPFRIRLPASAEGAIGSKVLVYDSDPLAGLIQIANRLAARARRLASFLGLYLVEDPVSEHNR